MEELIFSYFFVGAIDEKLNKFYKPQKEHFMFAFVVLLQTTNLSKTHSSIKIFVYN